MKAGVAQLLMVLTPVVTIATVGIGLRVGASPAVRAAVVSGASTSSKSSVRAWPVVVFDEDHGLREPAPGVALDVSAEAGGRVADWHGVTNEDGAAEMLFELPADPVHVSVRSGGRLLASGVTGDAVVPPSGPRDGVRSAWARFARREGEISLDVAVLGQRAASGFPASLWVHATDGTTRASLAGVSVTVEPDASLTPAATSVTTDDRGWAHVTATPLGYSVPLVLHVRAADGRTGEWAGGLFVSPGGSGIVARDVYSPDDNVTFDVVVPTVRTTSYVEIDDAQGRAWAAAVPLPASANGAPRATVVGPKLAPGLYWIVAAGDPSAGGLLGPGTMARPFFVARTPDAALAFGTDAATCAPAGDVRAVPRVVSSCLAVVAPTAVPRWVAVDGFVAQKSRDASQRARGLAIALGAIVLAIVLEAVLLLRASAVARARLRAAEASSPDGGEARLVGRTWSVTVGILVALMGFALLGAFLLRLN